MEVYLSFSRILAGRLKLVGDRQEAAGHIENSCSPGHTDFCGGQPEVVSINAAAGKADCDV
jgi:hypothetical protein